MTVLLNDDGPCFPIVHLFCFLAHPSMNKNDLNEPSFEIELWMIFSYHFLGSVMDLTKFHQKKRLQLDRRLSFIGF